MVLLVTEDAKKSFTPRLPQAAFARRCAARDGVEAGLVTPYASKKEKAIARRCAKDRDVAQAAAAKEARLKKAREVAIDPLAGFDSSRLSVAPREALDEEDEERLERERRARMVGRLPKVRS